MGYRVSFSVDASKVEQLRQAGANAVSIVQPILEDGLNALKQQAVQNLSGIPFTSQTGTHVINKRSGKGAASVQYQYPYGSPFRGRLFASAMTQYADNPEQWNYLAILEHGRGEVRPKYTPSMRAGNPERARLAIPGGPHGLVFGQQGFRGATGRYSFTKTLPPMEGKYWLSSAVETVQPEIAAIAQSHVDELLNS